jgi:comEA protein
MFPKTFTLHRVFVLLIFCGYLFLAPTASFSGQTEVNLNTATAEQLQTLPGIGPDLAQRILDYRAENGPFKNVDGLLNVKGIGKGKLAQLRDHIAVETLDRSEKESLGMVK